jgi:hypothetical protein
MSFLWEMALRRVRHLTALIGFNEPTRPRLIEPLFSMRTEGVPS